MATLWGLLFLGFAIYGFATFLRNLRTYLQNRLDNSSSSSSGATVTTRRAE